MAVGVLWKTDEKFVVQFSHVKPREKTVIFNSLKEWKESGSGFHKDGTEIFLFSNTTLDEDKVMSLVKSFPFPFTEEKRNGTTRKIRTKCTAKRKILTSTEKPAKIKGKRSCSRCGQIGHNSRTCKG